MGTESELTYNIGLGNYLKSKLNDERFLKNAKEKVVNKERQRLVETESRINELMIELDFDIGSEYLLRGEKEK